MSPPVPGSCPMAETVSNDPFPTPGEPDASPAPAPVSFPVWNGRDLLELAGFFCLGLVVLMLAAQAAGSLLTIYLGAPALTSDPVTLGMTQILMTNLLNGLVLFYIYRTVTVKYRSPFWSSLKWKGPTAAPAGRFLVLGGLLAVVMGALSSRIPGIEDLPVSGLLEHAQTAVFLGVTAIAVAPLVEEVVFRGYIFPVLERRWGSAAAVLLTALMFTSLHVTQLWGSWMAVSLILLVGLALSLVRARTGALLPAYLLHLAYNTTLCLLSLVGLALER